MNCVDAPLAGAGCATDPAGRAVTDHEYPTAPPSGSEPAPLSVTAVPAVVVAFPGQVAVGGNTGHTPSSSAFPSQSSSRPLHTSLAGPTPPPQGPHAPRIEQTCCPGLHCPTSLPQGFV